MNPRVVASQIATKLRKYPYMWARSLSFHHDGSPACIMAHINSTCRRFVGDDDLHQTTILRFKEAVAGPGAGVSLIAWNDHPGRTVEDVIALCDKVANQ